jgi:hypothetical protein
MARRIILSGWAECPAPASNGSVERGAMDDPRRAAFLGCRFAGLSSPAVLWAEPNQGPGATFLFSLPAAPEGRR